MRDRHPAYAGFWRTQGGDKRRRFWCAAWLPVMMNKPVRLLFGAWFMRARLVLPLLSRKMPIIGQARCDTALFLPPDDVSKPERGRPRTYGIKMTPEAIQNLPVTEVKLTQYGKEQLVRLRNVVAMARFLKGKLVRAVWCEFYDADKQRWSRTRLLLATETDLRAEEILHLHGRCWGIEPLFHDLKRWFVGCEQFVAAETHCAGVMDADSPDGVDTGLVIESGCGRSFSYRCRGAMARQTTTDRRSGGAVATHGIYRTCFQGQFEPEILDIHFPQTTRRPKITSVAAPSAASNISIIRFIPGLCHRLG